MTRSADAGFTLIETLVALAVLAMSAVALLGATEAHIARISDLELRAAAQWAAENRLAELMLGVDSDYGPQPILGVAFEVSADQTPTSDSELSRVDISATEPGTGRTYARLTGFLDIGAGK